MGTQKPRILPWLVSQLDQGKLEGVAWLDENRTRFRIPWKHGLRQDAQQKDFGIFQAWAEASRAYTPGKDKPDLPTWKRNFRSALNRKEVLRLVDDRSKDPHDPHKVYEFVSPAFRDLPEPDASPDTDGRWSTSDTPEDIVEELLSDMTLAPIPDGGPSSLAMAPEHPPQLSLNPNLDILAPCPNLEPPENPLRQLLVAEEAWEFEVTAFYRGRQVFQQTVFCPGGLRLVASEAVDGTLPGQPIRLPDPQAYLTDGGARNFVRSEGEVPKDHEGSVFDLGPFVADLIAFIGGSGRSPRYTLWFCMGESWPQDEPWTKRLVMVKVVPTCLRALLEMARIGGASSMENTVDLHISNSHPLSLTSDQYKAYLQDLVEDMDF